MRFWQGLSLFHEKRGHESVSAVSRAAHAVATGDSHAVEGSSDAADAVSRALKVLEYRNKLRLENVQYNNYKLSTPSESRSDPDSAPLDYSQKSVESSMKSNLNNQTTRRSSGTTDQYGYSIPPELREAARIVAELTPPSPSTGNHSAVAALMDAKYGNGVKDTSAPLQNHRTYNGLSDFVMNDQQFLLLGDHSDGVTDDTAAINLAISDGGRCGASCGSSTTYPAVVYFPPGDYLLSSPIIQYYNTQILGDPLGLPTIIGASSFVGLGVITSDVYVGDQDEWYINTNNFLRSVRNFKIDITRTDQHAYICAIHWQVAQGTSLENIYLYMTQDAETTQQGVYMENGSGGFMADLTFVGGNFGAYLGNQQFTTSHLVFVNSNTALQIQWDWAWTMQDVVVESCTTGITMLAGTGQGVGSFVLVDAIIASTPTGITTTLESENSTALLLQNVGFYNTRTAILDNTAGKTLIAGGDQTILESWGFGMVNDPDGARFVSGANLLAMNRTASTVGNTKYNTGPNFFTRRRPKYDELGNKQVMDVKALGAKGDGVTDDTVVLNSILTRAANMSSIVFFPHGVYIIKDTLNIPQNSRILGQAWSQIMATGDKFGDVKNPRVAVKVGKEGDEGIAEIQDLLFTVSGPTSGAVLVEWNIHESTQGSAGLWDSHFRVGGAKGSNLQATDCPKGSSSVNDNCIAAALMLRLTHSSSAYLENVWVWTADHDLIVESQDQIDVYTARGILIESQGPTWLYGTASEHQVLYQYELYQAENIVMGMIQTESPYFQPAPAATLPFTPGLFPGNPDFTNCTSGSVTCPVAWGVRIMDSSTVYLLGAGYNVSDSAATKYGGQVWSGWNETCLKDTTTGEYCNAVDFLEDMPKSELCSFCFVERLEMMQRSSYSFYDEGFQDELETVNTQCGLSVDTSMPPSLDAPPEFLPDPICVSNQTHHTVSGDTCDSIGLKYNVSSAALVMANNRQLVICDNLTPDMDLCLLMSCASTYTLQSNDTCTSIETSGDQEIGDVRKYNSWVEWDCSNLQSSTDFWGHVICLGTQGGTYNATAPVPGVTLAPEQNTGYSNLRVAPPSNATVAEGTTLKCGVWHVAAKGETCAQICVQESITSALFVEVNPSLTSSNCSDGLVVGNAYCVGPNSGWSISSNSTTSISTPGSSSLPAYATSSPN
ncbi:hypothetical protein N7488_005140 [Penicillium malachiteum]|nr:hypothetical protein N7488_005140 [Penicillium malachiteum]